MHLPVRVIPKDVKNAIGIARLIAPAMSSKVSRKQLSMIRPQSCEHGLRLRTVALP